MSNRPNFMRPPGNHRGGAPAPQPQQVNININSLEPMVCSNCSCPRFVQLITIRYLPALQSPNGQEGTAFMPAGVACADCGTENQAVVLSAYKKSVQDALDQEAADKTADDPA